MQEEEFFSVIEDNQQALRQIANNTSLGVAFSTLTHTYAKLKNMGPWKIDELDIEFILENDALTCAVVMAYARMFTSSNGATRFDKNVVPEPLRSIHEEIMELRHKRYAHHDDDHVSIEKQIEVDFDGEKFIVRPKTSLQITFGAPLHWEPLFDWLGKHLYDQIQDKVEKLTRKTGYDWAFLDGNPPPWVQRQELGES